jgi:hypothetical protein
MGLVRVRVRMLYSIVLSCFWFCGRVGILQPPPVFFSPSHQLLISVEIFKQYRADEVLPAERQLEISSEHKDKVKETNTI